MSSNEHPIKEALANSEIVVDRDTIHDGISRIAREIARDYGDEVPVMMTVLHGGLPFAAFLSMAIGDEGLTLAAIRDWCLEQGAKDVRIAALSVKQHDRAIPGLTADYVAVEVPDRYVFGFGMDYYEQGRNLPDIWALKL